MDWTFFRLPGEHTMKAATTARKRITKTGLDTRATKSKRVAATNGAKPKAAKETVKIDIPRLEIREMSVTLVGDRPLLLNNKMNIAEAVAAKYSGAGKSANVDTAPKPSQDEQYANAFYEMPESKYKSPDPRGKYGIPASGLRKCMASAIRTTGITDNTTIGLINKSFSVMDDDAGLIQIKFKKLVRDVRAVSIGSGAKTTPQMRYRPRFEGWSAVVRLKYNPKVIGPDQIVNLLMHAGQFIGYGEMREEKKQGQCGGFTVQDAK
jgi:hypothetical protein